MCLKYALLETKLGEVDRARAVFSHGSQISDPRTAKSYWKAWQEFEVRHGNEDTFREMLRIKRSVQAQFNTQVSVICKVGRGWAMVSVGSGIAKDQEKCQYSGWRHLRGGEGVGNGECGVWYC